MRGSWTWLVVVLVSASTTSCTRRKVPTAVRPYWSDLLRTADAMAMQCDRMLERVDPCISELDDAAPQIPLRGIASTPAFYAATATCYRDEPFAMCGFREVGGPYSPGACYDKFRSAGPGWDLPGKSGEAVAVSDDPACGLVAVRITRMTKSGGQMSLFVQLRGKPD